MTKEAKNKMHMRYFRNKNLLEKGWPLYEKLRVHLEREAPGKVVAIEVESGEYFLADSTIEAWKNGQRKYPRKDFYTVLVGGKVLFPPKNFPLASSDVTEDHRWFTTYMKDTIHYRGEYIAIANQSVIAHGDNAVTVAEEAKKYTPWPLLYKVPQYDTMII